MKFNNTFVVIIVLVLSIAVVTTTIIYYTVLSTERMERDSESTRITQVKLLSYILESKINDAAEILEVTSTRSTVKIAPYANSISEKLRGIPENLDTEKRKTAKDILSINNNFEYVFFSMPNGDIYLMEPYSKQITTSQLNFAFRDWYKGAILTHHTYVSETYVSATTNHRVVTIAVPIYSENSSLTGIWAGALDLHNLKEKVTDLDLGSNSRIVIVDQHGNEVIDSQSAPGTVKSWSYLESVKKATSGIIGTSSEMIDGKNMFVGYGPVRVGQNTWGVILMQPSQEYFVGVIAIKNQALIMISTSILLLSVVGYFLFRSFRINSKLAEEQKRLNKDLQLSNESLRNMDKAKEEFSSMITHELRTPLVPIQGYSELFLDGTLGDMTQKQREKIQIIYDNARHLYTLIQDILDAHKLELGRMKLDMQMTSANDIVEKCINTFKTTAMAKRITIKSTIRDDIALKCDANRILQVLNDLVGNAMKFVVNNGDGKIEIYVRKEDDLVIFDVKDNGEGVPKEKQENLFKKFYQADMTLNRKSGGTGLGLAICKGLVEAHKGKIWYDNAGMGSVFHFSLPSGAKNI